MHRGKVCIHDRVLLRGDQYGLAEGLVSVHGYGYGVGDIWAEPGEEGCTAVRRSLAVGSVNTYPGASRAGPYLDAARLLDLRYCGILDETYRNSQEDQCCNTEMADRSLPAEVSDSVPVFHDCHPGHDCFSLLVFPKVMLVSGTGT